MRTYAKFVLVALAATVALALGASVAGARNLSVTERETEVLFHPITLEFAGNNISCPITLLGHFNERTIPKTNTQVGVVRHVEPAIGTEPSPCTGGTITILQETLPWGVSYVGFRGTLPAIERIRLSLTGVALRVTPRGSATCLDGTTVRNPGFGEVLVGAGGRVEGLRADETISIPLSGGFLCSFASGRFSGSGSVTDLPRLHSITVTLI